MRNLSVRLIILSPKEPGMSAEPAVSTNAENPAGTAEKPAVRPAGPIPLPETDSSDAKKKRGSHRVMAAGGRVPNRLVFGSRSSKMEASDSHGGTIRFSPMIAPVVRAVRRYHPDEDIQVLQRAYEVANRCHEGQKRKSGDPYITHPVAVTAILGGDGRDRPRARRRPVCTTPWKTPTTRWSSSPKSSVRRSPTWSTA